MPEANPPSRPCPPRRPELLAPAGDWDCARAAVENGADAIYFGLSRFNARMRAQNFTEADLPPLMALLHRRGVRGYVTFNTLVFENELAEAEEFLRVIIAAGVDAAIVQDAGLCQLIRRLSPDFPIHASTQMTITSVAGVEFARELGCHLVVLARECPITEIASIRAALDRTASVGLPASAAAPAPFPLEVFVHGALCVAYSGQCLTSESLGGRSANRGECAQACRLPYDLISDGQQVPLGDRRYLLSPQDLSGVTVLPELVHAGVASLKIEGRLKTPEYVANITRTYRQALDDLRLPKDDLRAVDQPTRQSEIVNRQYEVEMAFSRGLHTGWLGGVNNQALVHARFGKKRGVFLGEVTRVDSRQVALQLQAPLKPGDGIVFDAGQPEQAEEGGRVYHVHARGGETWLSFGDDAVDFRRVHPGDKVWKTNDPELDRRVRQSFAGEQPHFLRPVSMTIRGAAGAPLTLLLSDGKGHEVRVDSAMPLAAAEKQPLTTERLREQLGRLGGSPFRLGELVNLLPADVMLPVSELNRLRREAVAKLETLRVEPPRWRLALPIESQPADSVTTADGEKHYSQSVVVSESVGNPPSAPQLIALVRNLPQLEAALRCGVRTIYCEFEDPKKYREAVRQFRDCQLADQGCGETAPPETGSQSPAIFVAPPRIFKTGEDWILEQVRSSQADGCLVRNYDHLARFADSRRIGDYSLNVANHLTADHFLNRFGLERVTASYDLNFQQLEALVQAAPAGRIEITLHQHMPMFHMEHCVFCAFLSQGTDYTNCGRPCDRHAVRLRDRVGAQHPVKADAGCRNTVFNSQAQTGAEHAGRLLALGVRHFRVEFLEETPAEVTRTIARYRQLLRGEITGAALWKELRLQNQLGVTRGQMAKEDRQTAAAAVQLARQW